MENRCAKKMKKLDMFGVRVCLSFNNEGETFNTYYGTLLSIMIYFIVFLFSGYRFYVLTQ